MSAYSFRIERVSARSGDGWHLQLLQNGTEMGDRVFPVPYGERAAKRVYVEALSAAQAWIAAHAHRK
ncbi:MAG TPA: hypothetical protein VF292_00415 [Rhodanobacteraceae bacterium]